MKDKVKKFWNWKQVRDETGSETRTLILDGTISDETWWGDEITPAMFREELESGTGPLQVYINSPGGDCFAASRIYSMLVEYPFDVTVKIDGIAASAASVIAMAGDNVLMARTGMIMIHNPSTIAVGEASDMQAAIRVLEEVKESIINSYEKKTGLRRAKLSAMMDEETWMNAKRALDLGFIDGFIGDAGQESADDQEPVEFSDRRAELAIIAKWNAANPAGAEDKAEAVEPDDIMIPDPERPGRIISELRKELDTIKPFM